MAVSAGISNYRGTYTQNVKLLSYLEKNGQKLGVNIPVSGANWSLSQPISVNQTTVPLVSITDIHGVTLTQALLPTKIYLVIEPNSNSNSEIIVCPNSGYDQGGSQFTNCTRGLSFSGSSEASNPTYERSHSSGASVIMSNVGQFYSNFVDIDSNQTVGGVKTFSSSPIVPTPASSATYAAASVDYVNSAVVSGGPNASATVKGVTKLSTAPASSTSPIAVGDNDTRVPTQDENNALVGTSGTAPSASNKYVDNADTATSGAGKILRLDGSGNLPAVSGANLTNLPIIPHSYLSSASLSCSSGTANSATATTTIPGTAKYAIVKGSGSANVYDSIQYGGNMIDNNIGSIAIADASQANGQNFVGANYSWSGSVLSLYYYSNSSVPSVTGTATVYFYAN